MSTCEGEQTQSAHGFTQKGGPRSGLGEHAGTVPTSLPLMAVMEDLFRAFT